MRHPYLLRLCLPCSFDIVPSGWSAHLSCCRDVHISLCLCLTAVFSPAEWNRTEQNRRAEWTSGKDRRRLRSETRPGGIAPYGEMVVLCIWRRDRRVIILSAPRRGAADVDDGRMSGGSSPAQDGQLQPVCVCIHAGRRWTDAVLHVHQFTNVLRPASSVQR